MPIKLPKGFPRRKSSGNVLDEVQTTPSPNNRDSVSSFRVLARPNSQGKSLDASSTLRPGYMASGGQSRSQQQLYPKPSFEDDNEDLFSVVRHETANRGSGGTSNSLSTNQYDSAASSTRLSSSSTNPSSVDNRSDRNVKPVTTSRLHEDGHPLPPPPALQPSKANFLKNAGRTWSFGINRNASKETNELPPVQMGQPEERSRRDTNTTARERAMTTSSITTATPPRLDDSSFSIKEADDDFGNMFSQIESKPSRDNLTSMRPPPLRSARAAPPQPIHVNNAVYVEESPYSWNSQNSNDGLFTSPSPSRTVTQASSQPSTLRNINMQSQRSNASEEDNLFEDSPLRRSPESLAVRPAASPASRPPPSAFPTSVMGRSRAPSNAAASTKSFRGNSNDFGMPAVDPTLLANAQLATQYEEKQASPPIGAQNNKIMSPAEFERYKQQKEDTRRYNKVFGKADSDEGSGDEYDDEEEDEQEREKQAVKQRKKQEAHLAVYRQQMMKVTGDIPTPDQQRTDPMGPYPVGNSSQLDLSMAERRMSSMTLDSKIPAGGIGRLPMDEEDEDEDVPLGILAAHGFPNKNRPPTRLNMSSSNPNLRNLAQHQGGTSVAGGESVRGGLPAFARNLPVDPYYGASIVQQTERQPLAMHASPSVNQLVTQPQPSGAATAHPLHPAGLVGVIAGEERARAMRRGSPNPQPATYEMPLGMPSQQQQTARGQQPMPGYSGQGMMPPPQMISPAEQAQLQMSQSMTQMMQMQMQWMQQMAGMMGQQPNMQMPMMGMPGMPSMQGGGMQMPGMPHMMNNGAPPTPPRHASPQLRPQSAPLQNFQIPGNNPRAMSTLSPSMAGWNNYSSPAVPQIHQTNASIYAPSIAPSERSNIGLASRYRPVSTNPQELETPNWAKRASTFTTSTFRPWANENSQNTSKLATTTVRPVQPADDEDDEQGWAEMKARKEKKQKSWKLRRGNTGGTLQELYNAPA